MAHSQDERLKYQLQLANGCCNHFQKMDKRLKDIFYEALTFYNFFFETDNKTEEENKAMDDLFSVVKLVSSANSAQIKWTFINEQWDYIKNLSHKLAAKRVEPKSE